MKNILQLKISLNHTSPLIWRRIQISEDSSFLDLHAAIQDAMGWEDDHLHSFTFEGKKAKSPTEIGPPTESSFVKTLPEKKELVKDWLGQKSQHCLYTYDYGDNWDHTILLEKTLPAEDGVQYPFCVAGERACPPEDCGGVWSYENKLAILHDPKHEEHEEVLEWMGEDFDPDEFNANEIVFARSDVHDLAKRKESFAALPIETVEDAMDELDHPVSGIPFKAIQFLRDAETSPELLSRIKHVLENAYNPGLVAADDFHDASPLWYAVVAEKHLDQGLILPAIRLLVSSTVDWDFLNEQARQLVCLLAEKYPEQTAAATVKAIDAAIELGLNSPYLFLFDVFMVVDAKKYEQDLLRWLGAPASPWRAPLAHLLADLHMTAAVPIMKNITEAMRSGEMGQRAAMIKDFDLHDIEQALEELEGTSRKHGSPPKPGYKQRGDWEEHYRRFEDSFIDDEGEDEDEDEDAYLLDQPYIAPPAIGRNEPCPCGSGKKYKKCHGS